MTQAKITKRDGYKCAPQGHSLQTFPFGAIVSGQVAEWAIADKAAQRMFDPRSDVQASVELETKAPAKRGRPRKDKS